MPSFQLKRFIKDNNLTNKIVSYVTGYNKNTLTRWCRDTSDEKIPLDFIYKLMKEYPNLDYKKYFPTYAKMLEITVKDASYI